MRVVEQVSVEAPAERVWQVLVDVEAWPTWTDSMTSVRLLDGDGLAEGSRVEVRQPRVPRAEWVVSELVDGASFTWTSRAPGLVSTASHELVDLGDATRVTLTYQTSGPLAGVLERLVGRTARRFVATEAAGLKQRCESGGAGR